MLNPSSWTEIFPEFSGLPATVTTMLDRHARTVRLDQGTVIFGPDKPAENLLLLVSGTVRVQQLSRSGRRNVLYRVHAGESCVLTTACLLAFQSRYAEGLSETDVEAVLFPRDRFNEMMMSQKEFRACMFKAYSDRITDLLTGPDESAVTKPSGPRILH